MNDVDLLVNEAKRLCYSLDGKVDPDKLRRQFAYTMGRQDPRRRGTNAAYSAALERAKLNHQLTQEEDGTVRLRDLCEILGILAVSVLALLLSMWLQRKG